MYAVLLSFSSTVYVSVNLKHQCFIVSFIMMAAVSIIDVKKAFKGVRCSLYGICQNVHNILACGIAGTAIPEIFWCARHRDHIHSGFPGTV
jgi:hypothetical protein